MKIEEVDGIESFSKNNKKHQIILTHTGRVVGDYLTSIKRRLRGKSRKVPNYVISREGVVYELMKPETHRAFFNDKEIDDTSITSINQNEYYVSTKDIDRLSETPESAPVNCDEKYVSVTTYEEPDWLSRPVDIAYFNPI